MAIMSVWIANRGCWRRMRCVSTWLPTCFACRSVLSGRRSKRDKAREPVFGAVGGSIGDGGATRAGRIAGGEYGQCRHHPHARGWSVSPQRRGIRKQFGGGAVLVCFQHATQLPHGCGGFRPPPRQTRKGVGRGKRGNSG